jgi:transposase
MWTPETRAEHDRDNLRYPSDLAEAEWQILAPLLPPPAETGRPRCWPMRELMNAVFFVLRGGCAWRMLPEHFPPHQMVYRWFTRFRDDGTWENLNHHLGDAGPRPRRPRSQPECGHHRQPERQDHGGRWPSGV